MSTLTLNKPSKYCLYLNFLIVIVSSSSYAQASDCATEAPPLLLTQEVALHRLELCNREIISAKRNVLASQADLQIAGQAPNPTLTAGIGEVNPKLGIGAGSYFDKTIDSSIRYEQVIERGGKRELRSRSAQQLVLAAKQDVSDMKRRQSILVIQAMVDLAAAVGKVNILSEIASLYQQTVNANNYRTKIGDMAPIDARRQEIDFTRAQIDLRQAQGDATSAQIKLATLLAWEHEANSLNVDPAILNSPAVDGQLDPAERYDVKAAKLRLQAALLQRDLAQAQSKVDITAGLQFDHWPTSQSNNTGTGDTFSVTLGFPLMLFHNNEGQIARATSDSDAAGEALQQTEANARVDWDQLNADLANAMARLRMLQNEQAPQAERVAHAAEFGYSKGALSVLDLLDARRVLRQTQLDVLAAQAEVARSTLVRNLWIVSTSNE